MDMIRQDRYLMNPPPIDFAGLIQEASEPMNYFALQYPPTILWNPDNVKPQSVLGVTSCPVPPCHASSMPETLPPRNSVSLRAGLDPGLERLGIAPRAFNFIQLSEVLLCNTSLWYGEYHSLAITSTAYRGGAATLSHLLYHGRESYDFDREPHPHRSNACA